jgi:hypothetical protein
MEPAAGALPRCPSAPHIRAAVLPETPMRFSDNVSKLEPSATMAVSSLAKRLAAEGRDILNLSAGEPDFDTPTFICDAAVRGIRDGQTRYTPPAGTPELRRAIAARLSERAGRTLEWEGVVVSSGAKQALFNAAFSLFGPGDEVIVPSPVLDDLSRPREDRAGRAGLRRRRRAPGLQGRSVAPRGAGERAHARARAQQPLQPHRRGLLEGGAPSHRRVGEGARRLAAERRDLP